MSAKADRLSRISALRPVSRNLERTPEAGGTSNWERLVQLLGGEVRSNNLGSHIYVQRRFSNPQAKEIDPRGLKLIASNAPDSISEWAISTCSVCGYSSCSRPQ